MIAIGIDPGATVGFATFDGATTTLHSTRDESWVLDRLRTWRPAIVAVESVEAVFGRARFGAAMGTALVRSAHQAGQFVAVARAAGHLVLEVPAARWRKGLTGSGQPTDARIKVALSACLLGLRSNAHQRDALGVARHAWVWAHRTDEGREAARCHEWKEVLGP